MPCAFLFQKGFPLGNGKSAFPHCETWSSDLLGPPAPTAVSSTLPHTAVPPEELGPGCSFSGSKCYNKASIQGLIGSVVLLWLSGHFSFLVFC